MEVAPTEYKLNSVDATRVGRYLLQEMLGKVHAPFADNSWTSGIILTSALFTRQKLIPS
jgi:carbon starvation protein